jgi:hypothetical protein
MAQKLTTKQLEAMLALGLLSAKGKKEAKAELARRKR